MFRFVLFWHVSQLAECIASNLFHIDINLTEQPQRSVFQAYINFYKPSLCNSELRHANPQSHHTLKNMSPFKIKWLTSTSPKTTVQDPASRAHRGIIEQNSITMWLSNNISEYNLAGVLQSDLAWCWLSTDIKNTATVSIEGVNSLNSFYTSPNSSSCSALRSSWEAGT